MNLAVLSLAAIFLFSCHSNKETKTEKAEQNTDARDNGTTGLQVSLTFFDSIAKKYELSAGQIRAHTSIDSFYFTNLYAEAVFSGDTVFRISNGIIVAIFNYDDRKNCGKKILAVFPDAAARSSAYTLIQRECDRDISSDYFYLRYKLLSDSTFETTEYMVPANKEEEDAGSVTERIKWKINKRGMIDSVITKEH